MLGLGLPASSSSAVATAFQSPASVLSSLDCFQSAATSSITAATAYMVCANTIYLARRSHLRNMSMKTLWKIRTTREDGVSRPLFCVMLCVWQAFVAVFPVAESLAKLSGHASFFYTYPKASGCGIILEPLNVQHLKSSRRAKEQIRFDWHRFSRNVGNVGRDGYRHPPSVTGNLPHLDIPKKKMKHWPWRRKEVWDGNQKWGGGDSASSSSSSSSSSTQ